MNSQGKLIYKSITLGFKLLWKNITYIALFSVIITAIFIAIYFPMSDYIMTKAVTPWDDEFYQVSNNLYFFNMSDFYILESLQSYRYTLLFYQISSTLVFLIISNFVVGLFFFGGILGYFKRALVKLPRKRSKHVMIERIDFKEFLTDGLRNIPFLFMLYIITAVIIFIFTKYSEYIEDLLSRVDCPQFLIVPLQVLAVIFLFVLSIFFRYVRLAAIFNRDGRETTRFKAMKNLKKGFCSAYKFINSNERSTKVFILFLIIGIIFLLWFAANFLLYEEKLKFSQNNFLKTLWLFFLNFGSFYFFFTQYAVAAVFFNLRSDH